MADIITVGKKKKKPFANILGTLKKIQDRKKKNRAAADFEEKKQG